MNNDGAPNNGNPGANEPGQPTQPAVPGLPKPGVPAQAPRPGPPAQAPARPAQPAAQAPTQQAAQPAQPAHQGIQAPPALDVRGLSGQVDEMRRQINNAVIGQEQVIDETIGAFLAGGHVLLEGVPGLGKTLLILAMAKSFGGTFQRVQFTPDLMPSDVTGHAIYSMETGEFRVRKGPVFTNLLLADEINRAPAKTQAALLEVMQERQISIEGTSYKLAPPFMTLATQNPLEQDGTYPLPEAQLDRFLFKTEIDYPEDHEEVSIVEWVTSGRIGNDLKVSEVKQVMSLEDAHAMQEMVAKIRVDRRIVEYAVAIVRATRTWPGVLVGAGPRGAISIVRASRAFALLGGRDHVVPDDVKDVCIPALRHRMQLAPELEIDGVQAAEVLGEILKKVEVPRQ